MRGGDCGCVGWVSRFSGIMVEGDPVIGGAVSLLYNSTTLVTQMVVLIGACLRACL